MARRILYMEDNEEYRTLYGGVLRDRGFDVTVCASKREAISALLRELPDLAVLDVSHRGDRDAGYEVCSEIRRISTDLPVIFLTNRHGEVDRISGFRLGADDYIPKGASMDYIVVRIEALLRRLDAIRGGRRHATPEPAASRAELELDELYSTVIWKGKKVDMPLTQFWILQELSANPGKVRTHRELMKAANIVVESNTITAHVKAIRRAFATRDPEFQCIRTERGRGYRWVANLH
ncbi:MAG: response regulator transcription factor [Pseudomonadota bacterium]